MIRLGRDFYERHVATVAQELLGKELVFNEHKVIITETEAYRGDDDAASHAFKGPTPRSKVMFGKPGLSYVYFIYGMYNCLNIVAESEGQAAAVLIRAAVRTEAPFLHVNGPGKLCRCLGITRNENGIDLTTSPNFYVIDNQVAVNHPIIISERIGIKQNTQMLWRFQVNMDKKDVG